MNKMNRVSVAFALFRVAMIGLPLSVYAEGGDHSCDVHILDTQDQRSVVQLRAEDGPLKLEGVDNALEDCALLKLSGSINMSPSIDLEGGTSVPAPQNTVSVSVTLGADVPAIVKDTSAKIDVAIRLDPTAVKLTKAIAALENCTIGYAGTIFAYEKANGALPISVDGRVLQIKFSYAFDCFRWGYALEKPIELKIGRFDKYYNDPLGEEERDKKDKAPVNRLDDRKKDTVYHLKNNLPTFGLAIGVVKECFSIDLSSLGRLTDYTYGKDPKEADPKTYIQASWGAHLGIQYRLLPKKLVVTGQGVYVYGLGDYISGLAAIQRDESRSEMCACYYLDQASHSLEQMEAWGIGGTLEYMATTQSLFSIAGSYLTMRKNEDKPGAAFKGSWKIVLPKFTYTFNKYWEMSAGYNIFKENKVAKGKSAPIKHTLAGSVKFSF